MNNIQSTSNKIVSGCGVKTLERIYLICNYKYLYDLFNGCFYI